MSGIPAWVEGLDAAVTVTDRQGKILAMNARAREVFADEGGGALVGGSVFDCHPEPARTKTRALYERPSPNHYTIRKRGARKIVHQLPWHEKGRFAGVVEITTTIPRRLPEFRR